jgi:hypothetical protein
MFCPHRQALTLLLLGVGSQTFAADAGTLIAQFPTGRLVAGCRDGGAPSSLSPAERDRFCRWVVRFQRHDAARGNVRMEKSDEQAAVEAALADFTAVQPAQIEGNRASVLTQRQTGEFTVVSLTKIDGVWKTTGILDASPRVAQPGRSRRQR